MRRYLPFHAINAIVVPVLIGYFVVVLLLYSTDRLSQSVYHFSNSIGLVLLLGYLWVYQYFWRRHERIIDQMMDYVTSSKTPDFRDLDLFLENQRLSSLAKRIYIHSNLLKKDYRDIKQVFEKFIPHNIRKDIGYAGYEKIVLGSAKSKYVSIMFLDIRGFTGMSEAVADPYKTLLLLNIFFDGIGEIIEKRWGFIDNFIGDGILAVFDDKDSYNIIETAIEIQDFMKSIQRYMVDGRHVDIGIGINTGDVIFGTIGTKERMSATVIGDVVNTASRIQMLTRDVDADILISDTTLRHLGNKDAFSIEWLGQHLPRGKKKPVNIYSVEKK